MGAFRLRAVRARQFLYFSHQVACVHLLSRRWVWLVLVLAFVSCPILLVWALRRQPSIVASSLPPLPQDPFIQVYFNHAQTATYTEPYRQRQRQGDDLEKLVIDTIASAQVSVDLAVHELNLPGVALALRERQQAGVQVRVILENQYRRPMSSLTAQDIARLDEHDRQAYQEFVQLVDQNRDGQMDAHEIANRDAIVILQNAAIPILDDTADGSRGSDLMHHKFLVVDQRVVVTGSANLTTSDVHGDFSSPDSRGNANHLLRITSPAVAQQFEQEFALMWGDGVGGKSDSLFGLKKPYRPPQTFTLAPNSSITVQFSPTSKRLSWQQSGNGLIGRVLGQAARSVDMALFVFSEQQLSNILEADHLRGVQIRVLIEPDFIYQNYSEALDLMGVALASNRCRYEPNNHPWATPLSTVGTPALPQGDRLHHKFGLVDGHLIITGSHNWSNAANTGNDEALLVIDNATVAAHFQREFDRLYQGAILGVPTALQQKIQQQQTRCRR